MDDGQGRNAEKCSLQHLQGQPVVQILKCNLSGVSGPSILLHGGFVRPPREWRCVVPCIEPTVFPPGQTTRGTILYVLGTTSLVELKPIAANSTGIGAIGLGLEVKEITK